MTPGRLLAVVAAAALGALAPAASAATPTDPQAAGQQPLKILRVGQALDLAGGALTDVPVLVADTGLDLQHPDIAPRLFSLPAAVSAPDADGVGNLPAVAAGRPGWDLIGTLAPGALAPDADPDDPPGGSGHGTAVAGVLGAAQNNGQGGAGVAPNARFVALRTCWDGDQCYQYVQAPAIDWAADRGARVASFSWLSGPLEAGLRKAIVDHPNVLFVTIPSGNGGADDADAGAEKPQPCALDVANVLCVSTSSPTDGLDCGAYGATSVDVAVPTQGNVTTTNGGGFGPTGCATSFAAPAAAGVATILFGIDPTASPAAVRSAIVDGARKVPAWTGKSVSGGIVDAAAAVTLFRQRRGIATPPAPGGGGGAPRDRTPPRLTVRRSGRTLTVSLSERSALRLTVQRALGGRRAGRLCRVPSRADRRAKRCTRWVLAAMLTRRSLPAGATRIALPTRASNGRRLRAGRYRATLTAADAAGNRSPTRLVVFQVAEP